MGASDLHIVFAGTPGVGKLTMMNTCVGQVVSKSGNAKGTGLTTDLISSKVGDVWYSDTLKLDDILGRENGAESLTKAIRTHGTLKLIFVTILESGRLSPNDFVALKSILIALEDSEIDPSNKYSVIINKCDKNISKNLAMKITKWSSWHSSKNVCPLNRIIFLKDYPSIKRENNQNHPDAEKLRRFVQLAPVIENDKLRIVTVFTDNWEDMKSKIMEIFSCVKEKLVFLGILFDNFLK